LQKPESKRECV